jgi:hypothetical protein
MGAGPVEMHSGGNPVEIRLKSGGNAQKKWE